MVIIGSPGVVCAVVVWVLLAGGAGVCEEFEGCFYGFGALIGGLERLRTVERFFRGLK